MEAVPLREQIVVSTPEKSCHVEGVNGIEHMARQRINTATKQHICCATLN